MNAAEALARIVRARYDLCGSPSRYPMEDSLAEYILEYAAGMGLAVVELPQPSAPSTYDFGEYCSAAWLISDSGDDETLDVAVYGEAIELDMPMYDNRFDPESARALAAALLAAANAAEANA